MPSITVRRVGRRSTGKAEYPIVYVPKDFAIALGIQPGNKVVLVLADDFTHFKVYPLPTFIKLRNDGRI